MRDNRGQREDRERSKRLESGRLARAEASHTEPQRPSEPNNQEFKINYMRSQNEGETGAESSGAHHAG